MQDPSFSRDLRSCDCLKPSDWLHVVFQQLKNKHDRVSSSVFLLCWNLNKFVIPTIGLACYENKTT